MDVQDSMTRMQASDRNCLSSVCETGGVFRGSLHVAESDFLMSDPRMDNQSGFNLKSLSIMQCEGRHDRGPMGSALTIQNKHLHRHVAC